MVTMTMLYETPRDLFEAKGQKLGPTQWHEITQHDIDTFADLIEDHQWIHVDVERAEVGPFGAPIVHGMLTASWVPTLMGELVRVEQTTFGVNYGFDRVRFLTPVPTGSRVRGSVEILDTTALKNGVRATFRVTVEVEGVARPACIADNIVIFYD